MQINWNETVMYYPLKRDTYSPVMGGDFGAWTHAFERGRTEGGFVGCHTTQYCEIHGNRM